MLDLDSWHVESRPCPCCSHLYACAPRPRIWNPQSTTLHTLTYPTTLTPLCRTTTLPAAVREDLVRGLVGTKYAPNAYNIAWNK